MYDSLATNGKIIVGDCVSAMRALDPETARLVIADPPYFQVQLKEAWDTAWPDEDAYLQWTHVWMDAAMQVLAPGGLLYCFGQPGKREQAMLHLMSQAARAWQFHDLIVWDRVVGADERRDSFTPAYELILVLRKPGQVAFDKSAVREPYDEATIVRYMKDKRYKNPNARREHLSRGKYATNIWRIPSLKGARSEKVGHPTQKPAALIERIVSSSSAPGDLVIDPFLGSGTTALVAEKLQRSWIGIEIDEGYAGIALERLRKFKQNRAGTVSGQGKLIEN